MNGAFRDWFSASRGVRQGDLLSPLLYTLVVDIISRTSDKGAQTGLIEGFKVGRGKVNVSHRQFVDDTILFLGADFEKFKYVLTLLQIFELICGMKINLLPCCHSCFFFR